MTGTGVEPCPLCNRPAHYIEVRHPANCRRFDCVQCHRFVIDKASEEYLADLPEGPRTERRNTLSELSSGAEAGKRLIIRAPYPGEKMPSVPANGTNKLIYYVE